ncbi:MAG: hypothetical protein JRE64_20545 [Deltaproteobacteria bacterium]|nr:hypothetical protein [Deltaproteobacteria bacterium]
MKNSIKTMFVVLAIVMSFVAVQSLCAAETGTVAGTIESISTRPNKIVVDGTEVSGIKFNYLCNQYTICLEVGDSVSIDYYEFVCSDDSIKNMAYSITVDDAEVTLRTVPGA